MLKEFKEFALRGNMVDLAIGIIIGGAFNQLINSLVNDIIMPPIGQILGRVDYTDLFLTLGPGEYESLTAAQEAGAATLNYGLFITNVINFLILALVVFFVVRAINRMRAKPEAKETPTTKACPYCTEAIPLQAKRCPHCTSDLEAVAADKTAATDQTAAAD